MRNAGPRDHKDRFARKCHHRMELRTVRAVFRPPAAAAEPIITLLYNAHGRHLKTATAQAQKFKVRRVFARVD